MVDERESGLDAKPEKDMHPAVRAHLEGEETAVEPKKPRIRAGLLLSGLCLIASGLYVAIYVTVQLSPLFGVATPAETAFFFGPVMIVVYAVAFLSAAAGVADLITACKPVPIAVQWVLLTLQAFAVVFFYMFRGFTNGIASVCFLLCLVSEGLRLCSICYAGIRRKAARGRTR